MIIQWPLCPKLVECSGFIISFIGIIYAPTDKLRVKKKSTKPKYKQAVEMPAITSINKIWSDEASYNETW